MFCDADPDNCKLCAFDGRANGSPLPSSGDCWTGYFRQLVPGIEPGQPAFCMLVARGGIILEPSNQLALVAASRRGS
jgi:hypothetical protein